MNVVNVSADAVGGKTIVPKTILKTNAVTTVNLFFIFIFLSPIFNLSFKRGELSELPYAVYAER